MRDAVDTINRLLQKPSSKKSTIKTKKVASNKGGFAVSGRNNAIIDKRKAR